MNERPPTLYRQTFSRGGGRSSLWLGAIVAGLIAGASLYISRAGDREEKPEQPSAVVAADDMARAKENASNQPTEITNMNDSELRKRLTPEQYKVTRKDGTEPPFHNAYWNNHEPGIYVDLISGEPLFASTDKFESGTGWPSFTKPIDKSKIVEKTDRSLFTSRTEVRSKKDDAHLGHVFDDGPAPTGLRYCLNSASLRFVSKDKMQEEGYGEYLHLLDDQAKK